MLLILALCKGPLRGGYGSDSASLSTQLDQLVAPAVLAADVLWS
jgi:hypothetical protein